MKATRTKFFATFLLLGSAAITPVVAAETSQEGVSAGASGRLVERSRNVLMAAASERNRRLGYYPEESRTLAGVISQEGTAGSGQRSASTGAAAVDQRGSDHHHRAHNHLANDIRVQLLEKHTGESVGAWNPRIRQKRSAAEPQPGHADERR